MSISIKLDQTQVEGFCQNLKSRGRLPRTIESYRRDATRFIEYLGRETLALNEIDPALLVSYQRFLADECEERENTVRRAVIGVRQFFRYLAASGSIRESPFDEVPIPERQELVPELSELDLAGLIENIHTKANDLVFARNSLIVSLIAIEGLKATEAIDLDWTDIFFGTVTTSILIRGLRSRSLTCSPVTAKCLKNYQAFYKQVEKHPHIQEQKSRKVLVSFRGRDASILIPHMTRHGLKFIIYELGQKFGIKHLNTEVLRHFAIQQHLASGKSPEQIMEHLGLRRLGIVGKHLAYGRSQSEQEF